MTFMRLQSNSDRNSIRPISVCFKGSPLSGGYFVYSAHVTSLKCKAFVQSTNTRIDIVYANHKKKGRY